MMGFHKILVPVDFSSSARLALDFGLAFASRCGGSVHVLHAWELTPAVRPDLTVNAERVDRKLADEARSAAENRMADFLKDVGLADRADVHAEVVPGEPDSAIVEMAEKGHFDLIAMGTHGRQGVAHVLLGSVAEKVVRHAPCPVLTVRSDK